MVIFHFVRPTQKDVTASPKSRLFDFFFVGRPKWKISNCKFPLVWALPKDPPKSRKIALFPGFWHLFFALPGVLWGGPARTGNFVNYHSNRPNMAPT